MAKFVKGDVVVIPFPFSDLSHTKRRPALVVTELSGEISFYAKLLANLFQISMLFL